MRRQAAKRAGNCRVRMRYENLRGEVRERLVGPYCLRVRPGKIYLLGHCHLWREREVIQAVLRFGALAEAFEPSELREAICAELHRMVELYGPSA